MSVEPKLSVVMSVFNGMPYLPATLDSLFAQEFSDFEVIVVDDGSRDDTPAYLASLDSERLTYRRLDSNVGTSDARNLALKLARAGLVAFLDADDLALPHWLTSLYPLMKFSSSPPVVLGCQCDVIDHAGSFLEEHPRLLEDASLRWAMLFDCPFVHSGTMCAKADILAVGGYRRRFNYSEDYDLWSRLALLGRMANSPEKLIKYRSHSNSVTVTKWTKQSSDACAIARAYAATLATELDDDRFAALHGFLRWGREPKLSETAVQARLFRAAVHHFTRDAQASAELKTAIRQEIDRIRWRCLRLSNLYVTNPVTSLRWLRLAGQFDPAEGTLSRIILRRLRRWTAGRQPAVEQAV